MELGSADLVFVSFHSVLEELYLYHYLPCKKITCLDIHVLF